MALGLRVMMDSPASLEVPAPLETLDCRGSAVLPACQVPEVRMVHLALQAARPEPYQLATS